jgi:superfamily II DNA/RNA helicase
MAPEIERITNTFLSNPAKIEVARAATTSENIKQGVVMFKGSRKDREGTEKRNLLRALIEGEGESCTNAIIFCNRKSDVDIVAKSLKKHGYNASPIHGDLDQSHRTKTLDGFRDGSIRFLVASDVAARGLDIPAVSHVFNFDVPSHAEDYVHRIGRTGRAGRKGAAIMICNPRDEKNFAAVEALVKMEVPRLDNPLTNKPAPTGDVEDDGRAVEDKPKRTRGGRGRKKPEQTPEVAAVVSEAAVEAHAEDVETQAAAPAPQEEKKRSRGGRGRRNDGDAERKTERNNDRGGERNADRGNDRGGDRNNNRGNDRGRGGRHENKTVGMGEDTPTFIAMSFTERSKT